MRSLNLDRIRVLTHSSIRIEAEAGTVVYVDPYDLVDETHDADIVCITHAHYDRFSPEDIARVAKPGTRLVVPASMAGEASRAGIDDVRTLQAGETIELDGIRISAVPAYNVMPERLGFHPRGNGWVGYVLTVDGARLYVAGDTDRNPDNMQVPCDVALVPVGGTYTMDASQAAEFVNALQPRVAIPTHYGSVAGEPQDGEAFAAQVAPDIEVVLKMER